MKELFLAQEKTKSKNNEKNIFAQFRILEIERFCLLRAKIKYKRVKSCFVIVDFNLFFRTGKMAFLLFLFIEKKATN